MNTKRSQDLDRDGIAVMESAHCPKCSTSFKFVKKPNPLMVHSDKPEPKKIPGKPLDCGYVMQIVSIGVRADNVYEARMLLAPEVDMSSVKITVKGSNLRVNVCRPLNDLFMSYFPKIIDNSSASDIIKRTMKHCENLLIPDGIDSAKVRAVVDNKNRMLVLTAPALKPSKNKG
ncbi:uncharacterized protein LOC105662879 isoform X2 [Megachile rotundata]|uniref:uncharacterized protein LOC105662879 isoform X2 n=1 Tax=Megachile rotundata TaxID=143995 RepID=UPI003FCF86BE